MSSSEPRRYIHIGYPKAASTSLQLSLFGSHPEVYHLGNGHSAVNHQYADRNVKEVFEVDFRFRRDLAYSQSSVDAALGRHFVAATGDPRVRAVGASSEFLSFTLHNEIDITSKVRRLLASFGFGTQIVVVVREQLALLESLYLELLKGGYPGTFHAFADYTVQFADRNWCLELCYDRVVDLYASAFGASNVLVVPFELLQVAPDHFVSVICSALGLTPTGVNLQALHPRVDNRAVYERVRRINCQWAHGYGAGFFEPIGADRLHGFVRESSGRPLDADYWMRSVVSPWILRLAAKLESVSGDHSVAEVDLTWPPTIRSKLAGLYGRSNLQLARVTGLNLESFGYAIA